MSQAQVNIIPGAGAAASCECAESPKWKAVRKAQLVISMLIAVGGVVVSALTGAYSGGQSAGAVNTRIDMRLHERERVGDDHEQRLRALETNIAEIRTDVKWIRERISGAGGAGASGGPGGGR